MASPKNVAIIISTTREPRVGPAIAGLVLKTLSTVSSEGINFKVIDIRDYNLPLFDEPGIPAKIKSSEGYEHEHTRQWSREIYKHDGFVFVTAQYNWSIPASLKNALDFLFHEWTAKPALIVSYAANGGERSASALAQICQGLRMVLHPEIVQLPLNVKPGFMDKAQHGILMDDAEELWESQLTRLKSVWQSFEQSVSW